LRKRIPKASASWIVEKRVAVQRAHATEGGQGTFAWRPEPYWGSHGTRSAAVRALMTGLEPDLLRASDAHIERHYQAWARNVKAHRVVRRKELEAVAKKKPTMIETRILVEGTMSTDFPVDMLRHDSCVPATEVGANLIGRGIRGSFSGSEAPIQIALRRFSPEGTRANAARWASFGWKVVEDDGA
jgi:hypothetical protein